MAWSLACSWLRLAIEHSVRLIFRCINPMSLFLCTACGFNSVLVPIVCFSFRSIFDLYCCFFAAWISSGTLLQKNFERLHCPVWISFLILGMNHDLLEYHLVSSQFLRKKKLSWQASVLAKVSEELFNSGHWCTMTHLPNSTRLSTSQFTVRNMYLSTYRPSPTQCTVTNCCTFVETSITTP